jgi:katanin p80 WD40 repeat-containing subunit B1
LLNNSLSIINNEPKSLLNNSLSIINNEAKAKKLTTSRFEYIASHDGINTLDLDLSKFMKKVVGRQVKLIMKMPDEFASEDEILDTMASNHVSIQTILSNRLSNIKNVRQVWQDQTKDSVKLSLSQLENINDSAVIADVLKIITLKPKIINIQLCTMILPLLSQLLFEIYEE